MRVLLLNAYAPPDRSATATILRDALGAFHRRGHHVTVVCGRPSYDARPPPWQLIERSVLDGARLVRVGSTAADRASMAGRIANYASFAALALPVAASITTDVVVSMTDPPIAPLLGAVTARTKRVPHVAWIQDLHPAFALATGLMTPSAGARLWEAGLARALGSAATVVALGRDMADRVVAAGARADRVEVVPNGGPSPRPASADPVLGPRLRAGAQLMVVHGGNIGHAGAWPALVAAARLVAADGVDLVFVGDGAERLAVQRMAAGGGNVRFVDRLDRVEVPAMLAAGDLHVVTTRNGVEGLVVPSKLYEILAAGRPVLVVGDRLSEAALVIEEHGCGLVADPDDSESVAAALRWAGAHPEELGAMGRAALRAAACYERTDMFDRLVRLVEAAAS